jgi:polyribonucleotide nucleotidyltransferase
LSFEAKTLSFHGRLTYGTLLELLAVSTDKKYQRALYEIYRYSNMLVATTIIADWDNYVPSIGSVIPNAVVTDLIAAGALVEIKLGVKGLLHTDAIENDLKIGDLITVTIQRKDPVNQKISLAMGVRYCEGILVPQNKMPLIIGKGASTIKCSQQRSNTKIENKPTIDNQNEFTIWVNSYEDVLRAKREIYNLAYPYELKLRFPSSRLGYLIGPKGETINRIKQETGAYIQIMNGTDFISLHFTEQNVQLALGRIRSIASPYSIEILPK